MSHILTQENLRAKSSGICTGQLDERKNAEWVHWVLWHLTSVPASCHPSTRSLTASAEIAQRGLGQHWASKGLSGSFSSWVVGTMNVKTQSNSMGWYSKVSCETWRIPQNNAQCLVSCKRPSLPCSEWAGPSNLLSFDLTVLPVS